MTPRSVHMQKLSPNSNRFRTAGLINHGSYMSKPTHVSPDIETPAQNLKTALRNIASPNPEVGSDLPDVSSDFPEVSSDFPAVVSDCIKIAWNRGFLK